MCFVYNSFCIYKAWDVLSDRLSMVKLYFQIKEELLM